MSEASESELLAKFSRNRLGGEPVPRDVERLLLHRSELSQRLAIELNAEEGWAPWLDTSYLRPEDLTNPDIVANVKAIHEVCQLMAFIACDEESQYYGYWRGAEMTSIEHAPLVLLDNEGQFRQCAGTNFAEAIYVDFAEVYGQKSGELRDWLRSLEINIRRETPETVPYREISYPPSRLHLELYKQYLPL